MKKKAFTMIELLISVTIITLISATSVMYFSDFSNSFSIKSDLSALEQDIKDLDNKVQTRQIYDYEIIFSTGSFYKIYVNNYDLENNVIFNSLNSGTGEISVSSHNNGLFESKIYSEDKFLEDKFLKQDEILNYDLTLFRNYKFENYLSGSRVNDIYISYFSDKKDLELINSGSLASPSNVSIKNILGKKIFSGVSDDKLSLVFEKAGKQETLILKK